MGTSRRAGKTTAARYPKAGITLALAAAALAAGAGPAGAHGGDTAKIHACIVPSSGYAQIVGANDACPKNYRAQDWAATDTNTTYSAGPGLALSSANVFSVTGVPWSKITDIPPGFADGVDDGGSWDDLDDIPPGFADGVDNGGSWNDLDDIPPDLLDGDADGSAGVLTQLASSDGTPNESGDLVSFTKIKHLESPDGGRILGSFIQDGTVQGQDIAGGAISASKLAGTYTGGTETTVGAVTSEKIADGSIEPRDLAPGVIDRIVTTMSVDPAAAAAASRVAVTVAFPGLGTHDVLTVSPPADLEDDLLFTGSDVLSPGMLTIYLYNPTADEIDGSSRMWTVRRLRMIR